MTEFTSEQLAIVRAYLAQVQERAIWTPDDWVAAMQFWGRGSPAWSEVYGFSVVNVHTALWWYQYRHKPGSKEWRPAVIIRALILASERDYVEPDRLPPNDVALSASPAAKARARRVFIEKHGVATFYRAIKPILDRRRRGGVNALFLEPATPETRDYVAILARLAGGEAV